MGNEFLQRIIILSLKIAICFVADRDCFVADDHCFVADRDCFVADDHCFLADCKNRKIFLNGGETIFT